MKISLAIISHNAEKNIRACLDSCLNQTFKDIDIVVVDDNSTDSTVKIIRECQLKDKRINLIVHETNKSALQARKTAISHVKHDYIWFIDSDDCIDDLGAVGIIHRFLKTSKNPDMVCFGSNDYLDDGVFKRKFYDWGRNKSLKEWKYDSDFRPYTRITKKTILDKVAKIIPDDLYLYRHNDMFMFCLVKLFIESKVFLDKALYRYTLSSTSVTNQKDKSSISKHIKLFDSLLSEYSKCAHKIEQQDVDIDGFIIKEKTKLIKYATQQYKNNPETYLHTLKEINKYDKKIIISLTTYSRRIETVEKVIDSLLKQTILIDKIILWLDEDEFELAELPAGLRGLLSDRFEIRFCANYKSYKKLIPTLELYPEATIITFDDDINYPEDQVEKLILAHFDYPTDIITNVARNIVVKNGVIEPYTEWSHVYEEQIGKPFIHLLPIGAGGVLYPQGALNKEVMNVEQFLKLAPHGDDLWFKCMTLLNGRRVVATGASYKLKERQIEGTSEIGLWQQVNKGTDSNLEQLTNICNNYKVVQKTILDKNNYVSTIDLNELLETYSRIKSMRLKKKSSLNGGDCEKLLDLIKDLKVDELMPDLKRTDSYSLISKSLDKRQVNYSPFKLANKLFCEEKFYEAATIYSYLSHENPDFKYYNLNYNKAKDIFEKKHKNSKNRIRWDNNLPKAQYDLAALDIILNNDEELTDDFFKAKLSKIKSLSDSHLILANYEITDKQKWLNNVNNWLKTYGIAELPFKEINVGNIFESTTYSSKKISKSTLVTVFLSVYNSEDTITYAVESLLNQTYSNLEIIIVDDFSSDGTKECLEELARSDNRIKLHINRKNRGTYYNRNYGLKVAKGKYFTVMDADDYALPDRINLQVEALSNNDLVGVLGNWVRVKPDGTFCCRYTWTSSYMQPAVATLLFEREKVVKSIGYYDNVRFGADTEFFERLKRVLSPKSIKTLDLPLCLSASLETSLTGNITSGIDFITGTSEVRLNYNKAWKLWHKEEKNLFIPYNSEERMFAAESKMLS
jgi:glycosyltransferase involved in cell wall biosynthesis